MKKEKFDISKLKKIEKNECFICNRKIPKEEIIFEDERFIVFLDMFPPTKEYSILAPKKHVEDITELSEQEYLNLQKVLYKVSVAIKSAFNPKRICLMNSGGLLTHFHFHLIPMYEEVYNNFIDIILKKNALKLSKKDKIKIVSEIKEQLSP